ncbi:unnamed protein product [Toxocara canis]|uniref:Uncharacterized protein n=1 Tax=Toxocara canis TaxID=6265 RepID=A0A3P7I9E5_TOXCA|nr:unnamed protein product [Toxocara canis]
MCRMRNKRTTDCFCRTTFLEWMESNGTMFDCNLRLSEWQIVIRNAMTDKIEADEQLTLTRDLDIREKGPKSRDDCIEEELTRIGVREGRKEQGGGDELEGIGSCANFHVRKLKKLNLRRRP